MRNRIPQPCIFLCCTALAVAGGSGVAAAQAIEKPAKAAPAADEKSPAGKPVESAPVVDLNLDVDVEGKEQQLTAGAALQWVQELEKEVAELKAKTATLGETLASTSAEAEQYKEDYGRMRLQMEALGIAALSGDERSLQLRLLNAVNDYRLAEKEKQQLAEQLVHLSEAALAFMKSGDTPSRERLELALREANGRLHSTSDQTKPVPTPLETAKVVSYKPDLGLAVINAGRDSGLRLGMPLRIIREDRPVANGVIVDCRDQLTGVLITTVDDESASVAVGDAIKLEPTKKSATKE